MLGKSKSRSEDRDQTSQQIVLSLDSLSYRTGSGTSHPVVKERALLSCRKANRQSLTIAIPSLLVNTLISRCSAGLQFTLRLCRRARHPAFLECGGSTPLSGLCGVITSRDARSALFALRTRLRSASQRGIRCFIFPYRRSLSFRARGPGPGARHNKGRDASVCVRVTPSKARGGACRVPKSRNPSASHGVIEPALLGLNAVCEGSAAMK